MILALEIVVGIALFTLIVVPMTLRDPVGALGDYPPDIRERCVELGLITGTKQRFSRAELLRKGIAMLVLAALLALILVKINGDRGFWQGFRDAYIIWLAITWFDALVLDCGWFCHTKRVQIPGTEGMAGYRNYGFHLRQSCIGSLLGLPACAVVGLAVALFA